VPAPSPTTRLAPNTPFPEEKLLNRVKWKACSLSLPRTKASHVTCSNLTSSPVPVPLRTAMPGKTSVDVFRDFDCQSRSPGLKVSWTPLLYGLTARL